MKRFLIPIWLIILTFHGILAQPPRENPPHLTLIFPQGMVLDNASGYGISSATLSTVDMLPGANPATLANFSSRRLGLSFQYNTNIKQPSPFLNGELGRLYPLIPQSAALVFPRKRVTFALGFNQKYSSKRDLDEISATIGVPGNEFSFNLIFDTYVYSASGMVAYTVQNFSHRESQLIIAAQLNVDFLRDFQKLDRVEARSIDQALTWKVGLLYKFMPYFHLGAYYDRGSHFEGTVQLNQEQLLTGREDSSIAAIPQDVKFVGDLPDKVVVGVMVNSGNTFSAAINAASVFWSGVSDALKDQVEFSGSVMAKISPQFLTSLGFYTTDRKFKDGDDSIYNAVYLTGGVSLHLSKVKFSFLIADSHLLSDEARKETMIKTGLNFPL